jgi:hypothetical protein
MRRILAVVALSIMVMALVGCGGGKPTDGGWLATCANWALFLQLSGTSGTADYVITVNGNMNHNHSDFVQVNNGQVITLSMTDVDFGFHGGCVGGCEYDISSGALTLHVSGSKDPFTGASKGRDLVFKSASASDFDNAVHNLKQQQG